MTVAARLDLDQLRLAVQEEYTDVAVCPTKGFHFHTGRLLARKLGYDQAQLDALPDVVVESFAGVGNPFALGPLRPGEVVVEVGSGAGLDAILAAQQVGPTGRVVGVDMTPAMVEKARANAARLGLTHVEFRQGLAEDLPVPDDWADVVISNGVINLCPDKEVVYRELFRILKPGGRIQIADIVVQEAVPEDAKEDIALWTGWIAGALLEAETVAIIRATGFEEVQVSAERYDAFQGAPSQSSAAEYGTQGVNVRARKPAA